MEEINVATNLHSIRQRISAAEKLANRDAGSVALLAVSKTKPDSLIRAAWNAGQRAFGENYAAHLAVFVFVITLIARGKKEAAY